MPRLVLGYIIRDRSGYVVWGTNTRHTKQVPDSPSTLLVVDKNYEWIDTALFLDVINADYPLFVGTSAPDAHS